MSSESSAATPRLVWAVGWGEYEQYDVIAVFATKEQAEEFVRVGNDREPLWGLFLAHRPLQLAESDADVLAMWPLAGELPEPSDV